MENPQPARAAGDDILAQILEKLQEQSLEIQALKQAQNTPSLNPPTLAFPDPSTPANPGHTRRIPAAALGGASQAKGPSRPPQIYG